MKIQVISSKVENVPTANGGYNKVVVTYKNLDNGKIEVKQVMDFTIKQVFERLKEAQQDEVLDVRNEKKPGKDGKDYWTWTEINRFDGAVPAAPLKGDPPAERDTQAKSGYTTRANTYETPEERAARQILIVRQSCLSNAVIFHKDQGKKPAVEDIIHVAKMFEDYVWDRGVAGLNDDVPL